MSLTPPPDHVGLLAEVPPAHDALGVTSVAELQRQIVAVMDFLGLKWCAEHNCIERKSEGSNMGSAPDDFVPPPV